MHFPFYHSASFSALDPESINDNVFAPTVGHPVFKGLMLCLLFVALTGCPELPEAPLPETSRNALVTVQLKPNTVSGGGYPDIKPDPNRPLNEKDRPFNVSTGPVRQLIETVSPQSEVVEVKPGSGPLREDVSLEVVNNVSDAPSVSANYPEPSVAANGEIVMQTGNWWMSFSTDGGRSFNSVSPSTIFPNDYGGFCCDQVLQYIPEYDMFVWLLQYSGDAAGENAIRIAVQTTDQLISSKATAWTYWDFKNTSVDDSSTFDYNDMSFGNKNLYWSSKIGSGTNRYVYRIPLSELRAKGTISADRTNATKANWAHVSQNGTSGVYWAGHENNSTITIYSMLDNDKFYSWRNVNINSWPNGNISSTTPNGADWLLDVRNDSYVSAVALDGNKLYMGWHASSDNNFPHPHIQIIEVDVRNYQLKNQMQVWNKDHAYAHPYFATNRRGKLGMIVGYGGGDFHASSAVGVWGDYKVYAARPSSGSVNKFGHFHTVRTGGENSLQWVASSYSTRTDGTHLPYFLRFDWN